MIRVNRIFAWVTPIAFLLMGIVYASILWFGGGLVANGSLQIGTVTAIVEYSMLTLAYLMIAAMVLLSYQNQSLVLNESKKYYKLKSKSKIPTNQKLYPSIQSMILSYPSNM